MKKIHFAYATLFFVCAALLVGWFVSLAPFLGSAARHGALKTLQIKGEIVHVSIADTNESRQQGLSGRPGLARDEGMLFIFPNDGTYSFWMKNMRFSIDIVWLSADGTILYIAQNISPDTYPQSFAPPVPARYVLELPAGYAAAHHVQEGDKVEL